MKRFILIAFLAACGGTDLTQDSAAAGAAQVCRVALGSPQGCLPLSGSCSCAIVGGDAVISFPSAVSSSSVAWVDDTNNEESIVTAKTTVESGAVHLTFSVASGPIPALNMAGWWWDITAQ